jgi:hypothetical protein
MVVSQTTSITPSEHADRHSVGGADPLVNPLLLHASRHEAGGADPITALSAMSDVSGSRANNTVYQNLTGKTLIVSVSGYKSTAGGIDLLSDASTPPTTQVATQSDGGGAFTANLIGFIQPNHYYKTINISVMYVWLEGTLI